MRGCWLLLGLAACFSPQPATGVPCDPTNPVCPNDQACLPAGGGFTCGGGVIASDGPGSDGPIDPDGSPTTRWTLLQTHGSTGGTLTIDPSTDGSTIIVAVECDDADVVSVDDDAGNDYSDVIFGRADNSTDLVGLELWYAQNAKGGATTITVTAPTRYAVVAWEVAGLKRFGDPIDDSDTLDDQPMSTMPFGAEVTTSEQGDFIVSAVVVHNQISGLTAGSDFTQDHNTFGNGWAHMTDNDAPPDTYQARFNQPINGKSCASTAAFYADN